MFAAWLRSSSGNEESFMAESEKEEIEKRRDEALRRALSTPPKAKQESGKMKERKPKSGASASAGKQSPSA